MILDATAGWARRRSRVLAGAMRRILLALLLPGLLVACGSAPPAPVDRFYRLQAEPLAGATLPAAGLRVGEVHADSLYAERPIVFVRADDPRQLRQYHYHLWLYPPAQTVRDHLRASLGEAAPGSAPLAVEARIVAFDRIVDDKHGSARAALHVTVSGAAGTLLDATYRAEAAASADSFSAFGAAMEAALRQIYAELLRDLAQAGAGRPASR